jgi:protein-tyrosine phosphatase
MNDWFAERYGSRRGFTQTLWHRMRFLAGDYRCYRQVEWESVERLVFVCKGNICRSAYAVAVARSLGVESISCGIHTGNGNPANKDAIRAAALKGVDLTGHRTTPIQSLVFSKNDLLLAMEPWQVEYIGRELGEECVCSLLGLWGNPVYPHIQDPYGASSAYFNNCFNYIEKSVHEISWKISKAGRY